MKYRALLTLTALVSSLLGALVVYLVFTVPNDLKAGELLNRAKSQMAAGKTVDARKTLTTLITQHPRTDAAAAGTVALVRLAENERARVERDLASVRKSHQQQAKLIADLQKSVQQIKSTPPPAPPVVAKPVAKKPPVVKKAPAKKPAPKKRTTTRRRR